MRALTAAFPKQLIFKGGTSLEKLRLIQRFSEDLDLLVVGGFTNVRAGKRALGAMCRVAANAVGGDPEDVKGGGDHGQQWRQAYISPPLAAEEQAGGLADPDRVLIELGQSGGAHPANVISVTSLLAQVMSDTGDDAPGTFDDLRPFDVLVLHPGRTLIEKLLRVNNFSVVDDQRDDVHGWPRIGRQFYDIWALLGDDQTRALLSDKELARSVLADCFRVSELYKGDRPLPQGGFARSAIFDPSGRWARRLRREHDVAMQRLYYGAGRGPTFDEVLDRVNGHADLLDLVP